MEWFKIDLKKSLGLAMPNQYCQKVKYINWFWSNILGARIP